MNEAQNEIIVGADSFLSVYFTHKGSSANLLIKSCIQFKDENETGYNRTNLSHDSHVCRRVELKLDETFSPTTVHHHQVEKHLVFDGVNYDRRIPQ